MDYVKRFRFTYTDGDKPQSVEKVFTWIEAIEFTAELTASGYKNIAMGIV